MLNRFGMEQRKIEKLPEEVFLFDATVTTHDVGGYDYTVVYIPEMIQSRLPLKKYPRLRVIAEISNVLTEAALHPCRGRWFLMVPKRIQKAASLRVGDVASVKFEVADQDHVEVPTKLLDAIHASDAASAVWNSLTPGKKRSFAYRVAAAKREKTQHRRIEETIDELVSLAERPTEHPED